MPIPATSPASPGPLVKPRVGVSSCLLGEPVRFNGGHSRCRFLTTSSAPTSTGSRSAPKSPSGSAAPARRYG